MPIPDPRIILIVLVAFIVSCLGSCEYGKHLQAVSDENTVLKDQKEALQAKSDKLVATQNQLSEALNENAQLRQKNTADAAAARNAVTGLRTQLNSYRAGLRAQPASAGNQYAITLADVFESCTVEYQQLAEASDGHAGDVKLLQDSWPK